MKYSLCQRSKAENVQLTAVPHTRTLAVVRLNLLRFESEEERIGLHSLKPNPGSRRPRKRDGRGEGSGVGKTSGRGHKGARSAIESAGGTCGVAES